MGYWGAMYHCQGLNRLNLSIGGLSKGDLYPIKSMKHGDVFFVLLRLRVGHACTIRGVLNVNVDEEMLVIYTGLEIEFCIMNVGYADTASEPSSRILDTRYLRGIDMGMESASRNIWNVVVTMIRIEYLPPAFGFRFTGNSFERVSVQYHRLW